MPKPIDQIPKIRSAVKFYRVMSWVTGGFLLLLVAEMILKYSPMHVEIFAGSPRGVLALEPVVPAANCDWYSLFVPGGLGCKIESLGVGFNVSLAILVVHGWIYVAYLFASFRLWSLLRWPFSRLLAMALGGVVPFSSFIVESRMHRVAAAELKELEGKRAALVAGAETAYAGEPGTGI